jgi:hypothetical protein
MVHLDRLRDREPAASIAIFWMAILLKDNSYFLERYEHDY